MCSERCKSEIVNNRRQAITRMPSKITRNFQLCYAYYQRFIYLLEYSVLFCLTHNLPSISVAMKKFVSPREDGPILVTRIM